MKIDVITYYESEGVIAVYIDNKLYEQGDDYHNSMQIWVDGLIEGIKLVISPTVELEINYWYLNDIGEEKFANAGYEFPVKISNKYSKYMIKNEDFE